MTPDEHEAQRRMVWIEAMKAVIVSPKGWQDLTIAEMADQSLTAFDARFPAPTKSENEG